MLLCILGVLLSVHSMMGVFRIEQRHLMMLFVAMPLDEEAFSTDLDRQGQGPSGWRSMTDRKSVV